MSVGRGRPFNEFPANRIPMLMCEGSCGEKLVRHKFRGFKSIRRVIKNKHWRLEWLEQADEVTVIQKGYVFKCSGCGHERIFGVDDDREAEEDRCSPDSERVSQAAELSRVQS